ncbi:porin [Aliivibrio sp. S4TY2]|uniref:porin n=1 Tax=unclassified Aliivibrio TaxID=2645654 RepID=UPI00237859E6|nr:MULTISPECIES: porin [unclassified Aliivibrio]MDD9157494.1 porin [Aliivibrio sp. S4TY2]MDD9161312.1 porin [Aliivibrio sp. S4TY1]MDD9165342.1 porin [Aliivibrio sp. S4MY2]MDD9169403.1 porin [Aliivibrio sp. S4MY4]MDD9186396.1 porin [Aliivibrio sp. S4MY3]
MKKTLVALSVLAASAGSAQAFEIYSQDGVTVDMGGDIEVVYKQGTSDGDEFQQEIQDADVKFDVRYAINDSLQFGGFFELQDTGTNEGDAYVALYSDTIGSIKVGRTCTVLDDAGIGSDYQFGIKTFFDGEDMYCVDEAVRWDIDKENFYAAAAIAQDKNGNTGLNNDSTYFDGKVGYRVADFDFTALVGLGEVGGDVVGSTKHDETLWSVQAAYNGVENLGLAAAYYSMDNESVVTSTIALAATYQLDVVALAAGFSNSSFDVSGEDDFSTWYVNAGYPIAPNTTAYAEVGGDNADNNQTGFAIGVKAAF